MKKIHPRIAAAYFLKVLILAAAYHLIARLGLQMAFVQANTSPVWPPSGIALAALLLMGRHFWPGITLGVVAGSLITGAPLSIALGLGLANTLEALIGAMLLERMDFHLQIDQIRDVVGLIAVATISTVVGASIGVASLYLTGIAGGASFLTLWGTWWVGNLLGMLVMLPFLLVWTKDLPKNFERKWMLEGGIFLALLTLVTVFVFENPGGSGIFHQALIYLIFPFAIWAALRLEQRGAATTVFVVSIISIWDTVHGRGPFSQLPMNDSLILLQTFTGVVSVTTLTLAASAAERRRAEFTLHRRVQDLAALNDASKDFLGNMDSSALLDAICRFAVVRLGLSAARIKIYAGNSADYPSEETISSFIDPSLDKVVLNRILSISDSVKFSKVNDVIGSEQGYSQPYCRAQFPLGSEGKASGELSVLHLGKGLLSEEETLLLDSYANLAAVAIQNAWLFEQVKIGNDQLHALSHRLISIQEEERLKLSRELHDQSGQILAALMVRLGLLERDSEIPDPRREHIAELRRIATEILNNLHDMAVMLRPASLDHLGLITALKQYIEEYASQHGVEVQFDAVEFENWRLSPEIETALFRIVQESLTNVALHAHAAHVDILLNRRNGSLIMTIEDNGVGFNFDILANEERLGLFGMRERVEMMGGRLMIESSPGKGTTISVEVPVEN